MWLKSHADGSRHTLRAYERIGRRFFESLAAARTNLRWATVDDVQSALEAMRTRRTAYRQRRHVNTYVAAVKAFLGFAHKVGFTRFNAAPLIKLKKAPRKVAQRLLSQVELHLLLRAASSGAIVSFWKLPTIGALRVSELVGLTWSQIVPRDTGEAQLNVIGKGDKTGASSFQLTSRRPCASCVPTPQLQSGFSHLGAPDQLRREGDSKAGRDQSCGVRSLAPPRPCQSRDRQGRAHYARLANARACGS